MYHAPNLGREPEFGVPWAKAIRPTRWGLNIFSEKTLNIVSGPRICKT